MGQARVEAFIQKQETNDRDKPAESRTDWTQIRKDLNMCAKHYIKDCKDFDEDFHPLLVFRRPVLAAHVTLEELPAKVGGGTSKDAKAAAVPFTKYSDDEYKKAKVLW